jgi:hypothetical protein
MILIATFLVNVLAMSYGLLAMKALSDFNSESLAVDTEIVYDVSGWFAKHAGRVCVHGNLSWIFVVKRNQITGTIGVRVHKTEMWTSALLRVRFGTFV